MALQLKSILTIIFLTSILVSCKNNENVADQKQKNNTNLSNNISNSVDANINSPFKLGVEYEQLKEIYATEEPEKVIIYEFFSYACPHCYTFEPYIEKLLKGQPKYVKLIRVPLGFQQGWDTYQQAYLTAEAMGIIEESHMKLFKSIHKEGKRFRTIDELADWYAEEIDVDKGEFLSTADSFILDSKQRMADKMGYKMGISSTPILIINGKYRVSKKIKRDEIIEIARYLIKKEAKSMGLVE